PQLVDGVTQDPLDGISMTYTFANANAPDRKKSQYFEIMGSRAIYQDGFIASAFGPRIPWETGFDPSIMTWTPDKDTWELYDLTSDFSQARDLAKSRPDLIEKMAKAFDVVAEENKVYPIGAGLWSVVFHPEDLPSNPATEFHYTQDVIRVPEFA